MPRLVSDSDFRQGVALFHRRRVGPARVALIRALSGTGAVPTWACQQFLQTYIQRGMAQEAGPALRRALPAGGPLLDYGLGYLARRAATVPEATAHLARAARDPRHADAARLELAALASAAGDYRRAQRLITASVRGFARRRDAWGVATAMAAAATLAVERGNNREALTLAERAVELKQACGDTLGHGYALQLAAKAHYLAADYASAFTTLRLAADIHRSGGHLLELAVTLNNLGLWHLDLASPVRAVDAFRAARRLFRALGDNWREAAVLANLGNAYRQLEQPRPCFACYAAAVALLDQVPGRDAQVVARTELAEAQSAFGRPGEALATLAVLSRARLSQRGRVLLDTENARALLGQGEVARARLAAARAERSGRRLLDSSHSAAPAHLKALAMHGEALLAAGRREAALGVLASAASGLERLRLAQRSPAARMGLVAASIHVHDLQVGALAGSGADRSAWAVAAALKARELRGGTAPSGQAAHGETARPESAFLRQLEAPLATPTQARHLATLRRRYLDASDDDGGAPPARAGGCESFRALQLGPHAALVEYHVGRRRSHAFAVGDFGCRAFTLDAGERDLGRAIDRLLAPLRDAAGNADARECLLAFDLAAAARLHRLILAPLLASLPSTVKRLLIVPDGPLAGLPFELLPLAPGREPSAGLPALASYAHPVYLGDRYVVSYAASSALLARRCSPSLPRAPRSLFALAYSPPREATLATPTGPVRVAALPGANAEMRLLAPLFGVRRIARGRKATAATYARYAGRYDVIHLAAHAVVDPGAPGLSGLAMAPSRSHGSGWLSAEALGRIPLRAGLVTLSACDTGRGRLRAREGVLGTARALLQSGAEAVLASLWPVDDRATLDLMAGFYRRLVAGVPRAAALATAKRELRQAYSRHLYPARAHPYFWAAFVLTDHRPEGVARWAAKPR